MLLGSVSVSCLFVTVCLLKVLIGEVDQLQIHLLYISISKFLISKNEILFIKSPILNNILPYTFSGFFHLKIFYL